MIFNITASKRNEKSTYLGVQFILRLSTTFPFKNFDFMRKIRGGEEGKTDESMIY